MDPATGFVLVCEEALGKLINPPGRQRTGNQSNTGFSGGSWGCLKFTCLQLPSQIHRGHLHFFALVGQVSRAKLCQRFRTKCLANYLSLNSPLGAGSCNCRGLRSSVPGHMTLRFSSEKASTFVFVFCQALLWNKDNAQPTVYHPDKA